MGVTMVLNEKIKNTTKTKQNKTKKQQLAI